MSFANRLPVSFLLCCAITTSACHREEAATTKAEKFGIPAALALHAIALKGGEAVIVKLSKNGFESLKATHPKFTNWHRLQPGAVIECDHLKLEADSRSAIEYATGANSKGRIEVVAYDETQETLYLLRAKLVL